MAEGAKRLVELPYGKWWLHETELGRRLGLKAKVSVSVQQQVTQMVSFFRNGGSGDRRRGTFEGSPYNKTDLRQENDLNVSYTSYGSKEQFSTSKLEIALPTVSYQPRYFAIGKGFRVHIQNQFMLLKAVTGEDNTLDSDTRKRRQKTWKAWYLKDKENGFSLYEKEDIPVLARKFAEWWPELFIQKADCINSSQSKAVGEQIQAMLVACNSAPGCDTRLSNPILVAAENQQVELDTRWPLKKRRLLHECQQSEYEQATTPPATIGAGLPKALTLPELRLLITNNLDELAAIEYAAHLRYKKGIVTLSDVRSKLKQSGMSEPETVHLNELCSLRSSLANSLTKNLKTAQSELLTKLPGGLFMPSSTELLFEWIASGRQYTDGE